MIRVGVVGAGTYGKVLINAYYGAHKRGEIDFVAIADVKQEALDAMKDKYGLKGYTDFNKMFENEKLDAVAVVTPDYLHEECVISAARHGIHVLAEKPLSTDIEASKRMIKACRDNNVMLYVDFHKRFDPAHIQLKTAISSGKLGQIEYGYVCMENRILVPSEWFRTWAQNSSPAWFLGIHFYDLVYWLLGEKPCRVYSTGHKKKLISMGIDTYDALESKFEFPSGATISIDVSWILPNSFCSIVNQQIRLVGTEGMQEVDSQERGVLAAYSTEQTSLEINSYGQQQINDPLAGSIPIGYTIDSMLYFLRLVTRIRKEGISYTELNADYPTGEQALVSTIMCQKAHESVVCGRILDIEYGTESL